MPADPADDQQAAEVKPIDPNGKAAAKPDADKGAADKPRDQLSVTHHTLSVGGQTLRYTVTTGTLVVKEETDKDGASEGHTAKATIFFIAYTRDDVGDQAARPLTFSFNGGPGSSSVWLHLGLLGPRRVWMDEVGNLPPPPYRLVDNEFTLLDQTDLVFIDPVSTGFSRPVPGEKAREYHGFKKDIESVGDFIRLYCSRYGRWTSPKFLIGESYGTTRAAGLAGYLQERHGLFLNGLMLVSVILNFQTARFDAGNDLPAILFLPTYTATAWYHHRLPPDLQSGTLAAAVRAAESFAIGPYASALMLGTSLTGETRDLIAAQVARFTGLSVAYVERTDLRVNIHRFVKELLREQGRTIGRLDSRFQGIDRDAAGEAHEFDPSLINVLAPYTATFNDYVRRELQYESDLPYEILTEKVWPWRSDHDGQYINVAETLRKAISQNPYLQVFVANGYYDLATPHYATEYTLNHMGLDPSLHDNVNLHYYEAGHMMYIHQPSLKQLHADLEAFVKGAVPPGGGRGTQGTEGTRGR